MMMRKNYVQTLVDLHSCRLVAGEKNLLIYITQDTLLQRINISICGDEEANQNLVVSNGAK